MKKILLITTTLLLTSCAFSPVSKPTSESATEIKYEKTLSIDSQKAFELSKKSLKLIGYTEELSLSEDGVIKTKPVLGKVTDQYDCGSWNGREITGSCDSIAFVKIVEQGENSIVNINTQCTTSFTGKNLWGMTTRKEVFDCTSKGVVENQFFKNIKTLMK